MSDFHRAFAAVIGVEGGYQKMRADSGNWTGGEIGSGTLAGTNYGISAETLSRIRGRPVTEAEMRNLPLEAAKAIYRSGYWKPVGGDELPSGIALIVFDMAVNYGPRRAVRFLQKALNARGASLRLDGRMGPKTLNAVKADTDHRYLIQKIAHQRAAFYRRIGRGSQAVFLRGWLNRNDHISHLAQKWLRGEDWVLPAPEAKPVLPAKFVPLESIGEIA